jgi:tryptophanyl-tRNA synthetase
MWIFSTVTPLGDLNRMTQFKDKAKQHAKNVNLGLYAYPVLQTADILLYKAKFVPVGEDQVQHIELAREIVRKFNSRFNTDIFPEPAEILSKASRIMGTDGENKMSKSKNNYIALDEDDKSVYKKIMGAKTDPARVRKTDPGTPEKCNIYSWHKIFSTEEELKYCYEGCKNASIGCVECKKIVYKHIIDLIAPIREKKEEILKDENYVKDVLEEGAKKCKAIAERTMEEVKEVLGLKL